MLLERCAVLFALMPHARKRGLGAVTKVVDGGFLWERLRGPTDADSG